MKLGKKTALIIVSVLMTSILVSCDLIPQLDITEEQQELVTEYAAGLLRKYSKNGASLKDPLSTLEEEDTEGDEAEVEEPEAETETAEPEAVESEAIESETENSDDAESETEDSQDASAQDVDPLVFTEDETEIGDAPLYEDISATGSSLGNAVGYPSIDMTYNGYEVCDRYPAQEDNSWLVSMSATEGKKLIVVHINIANNSDAEQECDVLNAGKSYRLLVNDSTRINESISVMMDAFGQYSANMASGQSDDTVLIFEASEDVASDIGSLALIVRDGSGSESIQLQ